MTVRLGDLAPDFVAETTEGGIEFHKWLGNSWGILFSNPADFTPVCITELEEVVKLKKEFDLRNTKTLFISANSIALLERWVHDFNETQKTKVNFPLIADPRFIISRQYGMVPPDAPDKFMIRSTFVVSPEKKISLIITYPESTGRNFDEIVRVIDSLQLTTNKKVATPANWRQGEDCVILPAVTSEEAKKSFPRGYKEVKPYLRLTPQPKVDYYFVSVN